MLDSMAPNEVREHEHWQEWGGDGVHRSPFPSTFKAFPNLYTCTRDNAGKHMMWAPDLHIISRGAQIPELEGGSGVHIDPHQDVTLGGLHPTLLWG